MSAFLTLIGLGISWVVILLFLGMIINTTRVKNGENINDSTTAFIQGLALGPIAILSGLDPRQQVTGKSGGLIFGGIVGTVVFLIIYFQL